jgi:hypothetical protein
MALVWVLQCASTIVETCAIHLVDNFKITVKKESIYSISRGFEIEE